MEQITRQIEWNVALWMQVFLYVGAFSGLGLSAWRLYRRYRVWRMGRPAGHTLSIQTGLARSVAWVFNRGKMSRDRFASTMHLLVLWGFIFLFIGTTLVFLEHQTPLHFFYGTFYLVASAVLDLAGVAFLVGLSMAVYRRYVRRASRVKNSRWIDALLGLTIAIGVTGFAVEGFRISVALPTFERVSFVGYALARMFRAAGLDASELTQFHRLSWVVHAALCIAFFFLATVYFFRHIVVAILSVALRPNRTSGALRAFELAPEVVPSGSVSDMTWKDLLDADACTTCGRCASVCPATTAGKSLNPRDVVLKLSDLVTRQVLARTASVPSAFDTISDQELWDCTTCGACVYECPVNIEVFDKIIDLRRQLVEIGRVPTAARTCLESLEQRQNPWDYDPARRTEWGESLKLPVATEVNKPEWVYWIGCAGAFEPSAQQISHSMVEILRLAKVTFAVLGSAERCTGDPARRIGDEALFQRFREKNLETLRGLGVHKIVTHCPHCLNTLKNEYGEDNSQEFEVVHHSQLLNRLITEGKIRLKHSLDDRTVTFHDPCYLGRHNGEFEAPRNVVDSLFGVKRVEMNRAREESFCCGGGGGQMWLQSVGPKRVESLRLAEAEQTGAGVIATACPFCKIMLETASVAARKQETIEVKDIAELINEAIER
jgi:Fe-S oxidoreductase